MQRKKSKKLKDKDGLMNYGLWLLAQRDMSRHSVKQKFVDYAEDKADIEPILDKLEEYGYLNDERFAEVYSRSCREYKGYGPIKIRFKMKEKGIPDRLISKYVNERDPVWKALAYDARARKFNELPADFDEKSRQTRFLASRGFSFDHISSAFGTERPDHENP